MTEIHHLVIPVAPASRSNPEGLAVSGHYLVRDGAVVICDAEGVATGDRVKLKDGESHRVIAARLLKRAWEDSLSKSDFNRTLDHGHYARWVF